MNKNSITNDAAIMRMKQIGSDVIRESAAESLQSEQVDVNGIVPESF